jgi:hypothetical protein
MKIATYARYYRHPVEKRRSEAKLVSPQASLRGSGMSPSFLMGFWDRHMRLQLQTDDQTSSQRQPRRFITRWRYFAGQKVIKNRLHTKLVTAATSLGHQLQRQIFNAAEQQQAV